MTQIVEPAGVTEQVTSLRHQLEATEAHNDLLREELQDTVHDQRVRESWADQELAAEDATWRRLSFNLEREFTRQGLNAVARNCRLMAVASPLIKRGLQLRIGYVWGQGVTVSARAADQAKNGQDVNALVQAFWSDDSNQASFSSSQAQEENERALGTDGNLFFALFTDPLVGRVQVRSTPFAEIIDVITNPDDRDEPWFYLRAYQTTVIRPFIAADGTRSTRSRGVEVKVLHPALRYRPQVRPKNIDGVDIAWDAPILHVPVNRLDGWKWGIPDAYAALPWARAYDGFLTDWARLVKALSKFAWRLTGDRASRAQNAAAKLAAAYPRPTVNGAAVPPLRGQVEGVTSDAGQVAATGPGVTLEAIPKSGATIDSNSGKPLAAMVASALGVSVIDLLADPGQTGARAVAETLDKPVTLEMQLRQALWASVIRQVLSYVVDQAVKAPRGPLKGTTVRDPFTGREQITLAGDTERTVDVSFPDLNELDPLQLVTAIVEADGTGKIPPEQTARLLLQALDVEDIDELLDDMRDEHGNFVLPEMSAGQAAADAFRRGEDPAATLQ